jgi:group I intron endonuclease
MRIKKSGIYCITNKLNGKRYIGCSVDIERRWYAHCCGKDPNSAIYRAIKHYGKDNFTFEVIMYCCQGWFPYWECHLIGKYNTIAPHGYNLCDGGLGTYTRTEEWRKRASLRNKGKKHTPEAVEKIRKAAIAQGGPNLSPEIRKLIGEKNLGKPGKRRGTKHSEAACTKIREARALQVTTDETRAKMSASMQGKNVGKTRSEESKQKMRDAWAKRKAIKD